MPAVRANDQTIFVSCAVSHFNSLLSCVSFSELFQLFAVRLGHAAHVIGCGFMSFSMVIHQLLKLLSGFRGRNNRAQTPIIFLLLL